MGQGRGVTMYLYLKSRKLGAIHIEFSTNFGISPLYSFSKWKNELIVDLPWARIILTPPENLKKDKKDTDKNGQKHHQQDSPLHPSVSGSASAHTEG
jgi:hypothetical protein